MKIKDSEKFLVKSSKNKDNYVVEVLLYEDGSVNLHCSCRAGENQTHCKHRVNIILGSLEKIVEPVDPTEAIKKVQEWVKGGPLEKLLSDWDTLEKEIKRKQDQLKRIKKQLARLFVSNED